MRTTWSFSTAGKIVFGPGAVRQLGQIVREMGLARVLLVSDEILAEAGAVQRVCKVLLQAGVTVDPFLGGRAEPPIETALECVERCRWFGPESLIGLGGGSNMDLAKIAAAMYMHGGEPQDYFGFDCVPGPVLPVICLPTTAGTGSEVSHSAVLTDTSARMKVSSLSHHLRPAAAVVDPDLTLSCPPRVTAGSGIDALVHAIEAYTVVDSKQLAEDGPNQPLAYQGRFPLADCLAEKAIALIGQHLLIAVQDGGNRQAREGMALASLLAGMAFSNAGVALVHALEYPLGGMLGCSHGDGNGLLLPYVMRFNLPQRTAAFARVAALLGCDVQGMDQRAAAAEAIEAVVQLRRQIGIPETIAQIGGKIEQLPEFAAKAYAVKRLMRLNPRHATQEDLLAILSQAMPLAEKPAIRTTKSSTPDNDL